MQSNLTTFMGKYALRVKYIDGNAQEIILNPYEIKWVLYLNIIRRDNIFTWECKGVINVRG